MRSIFLSVVITVFFVTGLSSANASSSDESDNELAKFASLIREAETMLRINADPVQRAIVCRVGFQRFSLGAIARATGLSRSKLMQAVRELMNLGLVNVADVAGEYILLEPADESAGEKLRNWAYRWCSNEEACEIARWRGENRSETNTIIAPFARRLLDASFRAQG